MDILNHSNIGKSLNTYLKRKNLEHSRWNSYKIESGEKLKNPTLMKKYN